MTEFYAQPYLLDHTGFYFNSLETFENGMEKLNARGCEEFAWSAAMPVTTVGRLHFLCTYVFSFGRANKELA